MLQPHYVELIKRILWNIGVLGVASGLLMIGQQQLQSPAPNVIVGLLGICAALAVVSLLHPKLAALLAQHDKYGLAFCAGGIGIIGLVVYWHTFPPTRSAGFLLTQWFIGNILFLAGVWLLDRKRSGVLPSGVQWSKQDIWIALAAFALAMFFRVAENNRIPLTASGDEMNMAMEAVRIRRGEITDPFTTGWLSHPTLWFYMQALSIDLFGQTLGGVRMLSALVGSLAAPALYMFGRLVFTRRIALLATIFLISYHLHIHFSRFALNNIADPLWGLLTLSAWVLALRTRRWLWYALTGASAGMAMYFYMGARLFLIVIVALWLLLALRHFRRWRAALQPQFWVPFAFVLAGFLVVGSPLFESFARYPDEFMARMNQQRWHREEIQAAAQATGQTEFKFVYEHVKRSVFAFNSFPDTSTFYDDTRPMLWGLGSALMLAGLILSLFRIPRLGYVILIVWFGLGIFFGSIIIHSAAWSPRYINMAPVVSLWIAIALDYVATLLEQQWPIRQRQRWATIGVTAVMLYLSVNSINGYFRDYVQREHIGGINTQLAMSLTYYLQEQPENTQVWFMVPPRMFYHGFSVLNYLSGHVKAVDVMEPVTTMSQVPPANNQYPTVYVLSPERLGELSLIRQVYPDGIYQELTWPLAQGTLAYVYRVESSR